MVRQESAKLLFGGSIPPVASKFNNLLEVFMSQRNKKKKLHRHLVKANSVSTPTVTQAVEPLKPELQAKSITTPTPVAPAAVIHASVTDVDSRQMRRDLLKVVGVLLVIAAILAVIFFTNRSDSWLSHTGNSLYTWLKLG